MKYDDAAWHYEGDYPKGLPDAAAATHIGMFLAWMLLNGLASEELLEDADSEIDDVQARRISGPTFVRRVLDEKLTDQEFSEHGNAFTLAYYKGLDNDSRYIDDYFQVFEVNEASLYGVEDSWENYERLAPLMDARFAAWKAQGQPLYIV